MLSGTGSEQLCVSQLFRVRQYKWQGKTATSDGHGLTVIKSIELRPWDCEAAIRATDTSFRYLGHLSEYPDQWSVHVVIVSPGPVLLDKALFRQRRKILAGRQPTNTEILLNRFDLAIGVAE